MIENPKSSETDADSLSARAERLIKLLNAKQHERDVQKGVDNLFYNAMDIDRVIKTLDELEKRISLGFNIHIWSPFVSELEALMKQAKDFDEDKYNERFKQHVDDWISRFNQKNSQF